MVRKGIIIKNTYEQPIWFENSNNIKINPKKLLIDIKKDFNKYLKDLRNINNIELRDKFNSKFTVI